MAGEPLMCQLHDEGAIIFGRSLNKFQVGLNSYVTSMEGLSIEEL